MSNVEKGTQFWFIMGETHASITKKTNVFCCLRIFEIDIKTFNYEPGVMAHT